MNVYCKGKSYGQNTLALFTVAKLFFNFVVHHYSDWFVVNTAYREDWPNCDKCLQGDLSQCSAFLDSS